jgi:hypothetical protein
MKSVLTTVIEKLVSTPFLGHALIHKHDEVLVRCQPGILVSARFDSCVEDDRTSQTALIKQSTELVSEFTYSMSVRFRQFDIKIVMMVSRQPIDSTNIEDV